MRRLFVFVGIADFSRSSQKKKTAFLQSGFHIFFRSQFLNENIDDGFFSWFQKYLNELKAENRIGSYKSYNNAFQAFKRFRQNRDLNPSEITVALLKAFEKHLLDNGANETTVGIYMRALKVIYNYVADFHPGLKENYPFAIKQNDKRRYRIGTTSNKKGDALSPALLGKFMQVETIPTSAEHEAKLYWLFSFYCQGMNMRDIANLKYRNIQGEAIRYVRQKTSATTKDGREIEVLLTPEAKQILIEVGNTDKRPNAFVFPILDAGMDLMKQDAVIRQKIKIVNKWLKRICDNNELPVITTYWARRTFASLSKFAGVETSLIRELLGHGDLKTTETYLKRFELDKKKEANELLKGLLQKAS
jgi:integrase/recombinase XerD